MSGAHAFVDDLDAPVLSPDDRHHLERVLRLRTGEEMTVSDGAGGRRRCRFGPSLEPVGDVEREKRPSPEVTVAFAVVKGQRPEWAVQKLTEIGVDRIVPVVTARSVVRWPVGAHVDRLARVAREAAMQSRRAWLPVVAAVSTFAVLSAEDGVALAHPGGRSPSLRHPTVMVGPEGGWDDAELTVGTPLVRLGAHVLRTETAAVVAGALLCALRDESVQTVDSGG
jgi:16S rRNA (uracil1498-N3)-methyltransferase